MSYGGSDQSPVELMDTPESNGRSAVSRLVEPTSSTVDGRPWHPAPGDDLRVEDDLDRVRLFGLDFVDAPDVAAVADALLDGPYRSDRLPMVVTPNVDIVVFLDREASELDREIAREAQFCLPDGQPIVLASRLIGRPLRARLAGSDLFAELWPRLVADRVGVAVIASSAAVADLLRQEHPEAVVVVAPLFYASDLTAIDGIIDELLLALDGRRPELVLSGISYPKDPRVLFRLIERWPADMGPLPIGLGLGASFSMYLGLSRRAPVWVQRLSLEWFYRFVQEPRRLFRRYFLKDPAFVGIVRREWRRSKRHEENQ